MILEIFFTGLIAFVKGSCTLNHAKTMKIVLVQGDKDEHGIVVAHVPTLVVSIDDVDPLSPTKPDEVIVLPDKQQLAVWHLDNQQITLAGVREGKRLVPVPEFQIYEGHRKRSDDNVYEKPRPTPIANRADDISWAPEMHRACGVPESGAYPRKEVTDIDDKALTYKDGEQFAVARFKVLPVAPTGEKPGHADNELVADLDEDDRRVFKFPANEPYKQMLAESAKLKLTFDNPGSFQIDLLDLGDLKTKTILLKTNRSKLTATVSNLPTMLHAKEGGKATVDHFQYYLKLSELDPKKCPVPTEDTTVLIDRPSFRSGHPVKCTICIDCGP